MSYEEEKQDRKIEQLEAEIERVRARDKQNAAAIVAMADGAKRYVLSTHAIIKVVFDEADSLVDYCEKLEKIVIAKDARIQELEDALVEKQTALMPSAPRCYAEARRQAAIEQLRAEGKIGPDDSKKISHLRPYEVVAADLAGMLAKSWQITDERKAAILHCKRMLTFLKEDDAPCYDVEKITKDESVLVAMLEEAGQ